MNLQQIRIVVKALELNFNLTAVAQNLYTTQPAVSRAILDLEDELGSKLFIRRGKRLTALSTEGISFVESAKRIMSEIGNIRTMSKDWQDESQGRLVIATTHTQARYNLPPILQEFRRRFPKVQLAIHQGSPQEIAKYLIDGSAQFAVATEGLFNVQDFATYPLIKWHHLAIIPNLHPLKKYANEKSKDKIKIEELAKYALILHDRAFAGRSRIDFAFQQAKINPQVVIEAVDADVIKTYVQNKMGVGILPSIAFSPKIDKGISAIPVGHLFGINTTWIAHHRLRYLRKFELAFINICNPGV